MICLVFDVDDTFYKRSDPFIKTCQDVLGKHMTLDWMALYKRRQYYADFIFEASCKGEISMEEMYLYRLEKALEEFGQTTTLDEVLYFEKRYEYFQSRLSLDPPFESLLTKLKDKGIPMAILTNGPTAHQKNKIYSLALSRWIPEEKWYISGDIGMPKPHKETFDYVQQHLAFPKEDLWMIGDNYDVDIIGAINAGWHSIWYNYANKPVPEGCPHPDLEATDPEEIESVILSLF